MSFFEFHVFPSMVEFLKQQQQHRGRNWVFLRLPSCKPLCERQDCLFQPWFPGKSNLRIADSPRKPCPSKTCWKMLEDSMTNSFPSRVSTSSFPKLTCWVARKPFWVQPKCHQLVTSWMGWSEWLSQTDRAWRKLQPQLVGPRSDWNSLRGCIGLCTRHRGILQSNNECGTPCVGPKSLANKSRQITFL